MTITIYLHKEDFLRDIAVLKTVTAYTVENMVHCIQYFNELKMLTYQKDKNWIGVQITEEEFHLLNIFNNRK